MKKISCALAGWLFLFSAIQAQVPPVKSVSIFKNGSAFFLRSGQVTCENNSWSWIDGLPEASFGTLWFISPESRIKEVTSSTKDIISDRDLTSMYEELAYNKGKRVKLVAKPYPNTNETREYTGLLEQVRAEMIIIRTDNAWVTLNSNEIVRVEFLEKPTWTTPQTDRKKVFKVDFNTPGSTQNLDIMYLRRNLGWLPNYLIELRGDDKAEITLSTTVFNQAEDIEKSEINFVVGVPNFAYEHVVTPLVSKASFGDFLTLLNAPRYSGIAVGINSNAITFQNQYSGGAVVNPEPVEIRGDDFAEAEGKSGEDLFFYTVRDATLRNGDHGVFELLRAQITCKHIFEAQLENNQPSYAYYSQYNDDNARTTQSFHSVQLENNTIFPWTTGTVMVMTNDQSGSGSKPVSQDMLNYTPPKGKTTIKLTSVPDIGVRDSERELTRVENKRTVARVKYDLVTIEGKVVVKNYKDKAVNLNVKRQITGMLKKSTPDWLTEAKFKEYRTELNERWDVCFELELKPGEERTLTYEYEVYIAK
jgi:hypothetical protein